MKIGVGFGFGFVIALAVALGVLAISNCYEAASDVI
jgi:hypothetical protein